MGSVLVGYMALIVIFAPAARPYHFVHLPPAPLSKATSILQ